MTRATGVVAMLGLWASMAGCGVDSTAVCEEMQSCRGGNDKDLDACIETVDLAEDLADMQGCSDEFELYVECLLDHATCEDVTTGGACQSDGDCASIDGARCQGGTCVAKSWGVVGDQCDTESRAWSRCDEMLGGVF